MAGSDPDTEDRRISDTDPETTILPADEPSFDEVFDANTDESVDQLSAEKAVFVSDIVQEKTTFSIDDDEFAEPVFEAESTRADFEQTEYKVTGRGMFTMSMVTTSLMAIRSKIGGFLAARALSRDDPWTAADTVTEAPKPGRRLGRTGPFWLIGAGVAAVLLFGIWFGFIRTTDTDPAVGGSAAVTTGQAGSVSMPGEADGAASSAVPTVEAIPTETPIPALIAGQQVVVGNTAGAGIRLRNEPGLGGLTLAIYEDGDLFTVLNPDGDYTKYPVEADGYRWYRIQIADNPEEDLSGWAVGDFLVATQ